MVLVVVCACGPSAQVYFAQKVGDPCAHAPESDGYERMRSRGIWWSVMLLYVYAYNTSLSMMVNFALYPVA